MEGDALRGSDAMFYFKAAPAGASSPPASLAAPPCHVHDSLTRFPPPACCKLPAADFQDLLLLLPCGSPHAGQPHGGSRARRSRVDSLFYFKGHRGAGGGGQREPLPGSEEPPGVESLAEDGHGTVWGELGPAAAAVLRGGVGGGGGGWGEASTGAGRAACASGRA